MNRKLAALACLFVVVAAACGREATTTTSSEPKTLKVVVLPYMDFGPLYIAKDKGYFEDQNLTVKFVPMFNSQAALPGLARGQYDVVGGGVSVGLINAVARGTNIKVVADKSYWGQERDCSSSVIAVTPSLLDSGEIKTADDLKGRKVRANPNNLEAYALDTFLKTAGLSLDDVEDIDIPVPNIVDSMGTNDLDVALISDPTLTRLVDAGKGKVWVEVDRDVLPGLQVGTIMYGPNLLTKDEDAGLRFLIAYEQGVKDFRKGPTAENVRIVSKATENEASLIKRVCWPTFHEDGRIDWGSVDKMQQWAKGRKLVDDTITEDEFWTDEFVTDALERL